METVRRVVKRPSVLEPLRSLEREAREISRMPDEIEQEVAMHLEDILEAEEARKKAEGRGGPAIPVFFKPKPKKNSIMDLVKKQAKVRRDQVKQDTILDEEQIQHIWYLIEEFAVMDGEEAKLNYDGFSQLATRCRELYGPQVSVFFKASTFQMFEQDGDGCISANIFAAYLGQRSEILSQRLQLSCFDADDTGWLTDFQLEDFIRSCIPDMAVVEEDMQASFLPNYTRIAARKFMFFHGKNGKVRIRDLVNSSVLREMMELKLRNVRENQLLSNWFSVQSAQRVYSTFQQLDEDMNGMLSRSEFSSISNGTMSPLFISRIFEEHVMQQKVVYGRHPHRDEMDLMAFTDFVLAWDHRASVAAVKYFFPVFDLSKQGFITPADVYTFFKEIHVMWVAMGEYADLAIYDVVDEILDMIKPKMSPKISREDLIESKQSGLFFQMLADVKQFYEYNYRENNLHSDDDDQ